MTYWLELNNLTLERIAIAFGDNRATLVVQDLRGKHPIRIDDVTWLRGTTDERGVGDELGAVSGAWTAADTFAVRTCFYDSELCPVSHIHVADSELRLEVEPNVAWGPTTVTTIAGCTASAPA